MLASGKEKRATQPAIHPNALCNARKRFAHSPNQVSGCQNTRLLDEVNI